MISSASLTTSKLQCTENPREPQRIKWLRCLAPQTGRGLRLMAFTLVIQCVVADECGMRGCQRTDDLQKRVLCIETSSQHTISAALKTCSTCRGKNKKLITVAEGEKKKTKWDKAAKSPKRSYTKTTITGIVLTAAGKQRDPAYMKHKNTHFKRANENIKRALKRARAKLASNNPISDECVVCMEDFKKGDRVRKCSKCSAWNLHLRCYNEWIPTHRTPGKCPVCQQTTSFPSSSKLRRLCASPVLTRLLRDIEEA